jgi:hypothetical protein
MSLLAKLFVVASIAMLSFASPGSAQSFSIHSGTGNVLPAYFDANGDLHRGIAPPQNTEIAVCSVSKFEDILTFGFSSVGAFLSKLNFEFLHLSPSPTLPLTASYSRPLESTEAC